MHYLWKLANQKNHFCPLPEAMSSCLDVGCGNGVWMMEMASAFPGCHFVGIDLAPEAPTTIHPRNCTFDTGDFLSGAGLPYEDESFDMVHVRHVLAWQTPSHADRLLDEIVRVTKRGGRIEIQEPDTILRSATPGIHLTQYNNAWITLMKQRGLDIGLTRDLREPLLQRGVEASYCERISNPVGRWGGPVGELWIPEAAGVLKVMRPRLQPVLGLDSVGYDGWVEGCFNEFERCRAYMDFYAVWGTKQ